MTESFDDIFAKIIEVILRCADTSSASIGDKNLKIMSLRSFGMSCHEGFHVFWVCSRLVLDDFFGIIIPSD